MDIDKGAKIVRLVDLLSSEKLVAWQEVEELVNDFPGWRHMVERLHYPTPRITSIGDPAQYTFLPRGMPQRLLAIFQPYALLLDARLEPAERAVRLHRDLGIDVTRFCKESLHDGSPEVSVAARSVLEACNNDRTLLRSASVPGDPPQQLLRTTSGDNSPSDALLHPSSPPSPHNRTEKIGWFRRLFGRRDT